MLIFDKSHYGFTLVQAAKMSELHQKLIYTFLPSVRLTVQTEEERVWQWQYFKKCRPYFCTVLI